MDAKKLPVGSSAVDTRTGRIGIVMGHEGPYVQLRPYGGGREWDAGPDAVRRATPAERRNATAERGSATAVHAQTPAHAPGRDEAVPYGDEVASGEL